MNDLVPLLLGVALQVTLLALAGAALYLVAARRGPGAAAPVAAVCLVGCVALTLLALCPLPAWWAWRPASARDPGTALALPELPEPLPDVRLDPERPRAASGGFRWSIGFPPGSGDQARSSDALPTPPREWGGLVAGVFLFGAGLCLLRLLLGVVAVRRLRLRSTVLDDPAFLETAEALRREMGCPRVELRESPDLATPATVGWLRPVVLLPSDWRSWGTAERRAALAHELAHVRRRDYLTGLLARLSVALHFYHPLLRWLAERLRLQQELAADALGARFAGGPGPYLRSLARLALRQDGRSPGWLARPLFSSRGTLMRRIDMLRTRDGSRQLALSRLARAAMVGVLVAAAVGLSALRSPAQKNERKETAQAEAAPFDISYLPADSMGAVALRPAALFRRPGLKKTAAKFNDGIANLFKDLKLSAGVDLGVEDVEQVVFKLEFKTDPKLKDGKTSMLLGAAMVRTTKPFDWKKQVCALVPDAVEVKYRGRTYISVSKDKPMLGMLLGIEGCCYIPDDRTLVCGSEDEICRLLDRKPGEGPAFAWADDWKRVQDGVVAVALDNSDGRLRRELRARRPLEPELAPFCEHLRYLTFGFNGEDDFAFRALLRTDTGPGAEAVARALEGGLSLARKELTARPGDKPLDESDRTAQTFFLDLLDGVKLRREGKSVEVRGNTRTDFDRLVRIGFLNEEP
jgi:beta-lactamase regulating signal transducer with metallopeptidase domain